MPGSRSRSPVRSAHRQGRGYYDDAQASGSRHSHTHAPPRSRSRSVDRRSRTPLRYHLKSPRRSRSDSRERGRRRKSSRSRSRESSVERKKRRRRSRSISGSSEASERTSDRKKERRKRKRSRSNERRRDKKRTKKDRKDKKRKEKANVVHWGKYGIISDTDIFRKDQEFRIWLVEERKINPETISKEQEKKEFARFVEDYNTASLPHEKYYNMEEYERRMSALRQGDYLPPADDLYDFNADMKALSSAHKKKTGEQDSYMTKEELMELRKVQQQRNEIGRMKLLGMDVKQNFGVRMDTAYD